jgi:outer membrane murein-binding lipoprotein Lpp
MMRRAFVLVTVFVAALAVLAPPVFAGSASKGRSTTMERRVAALEAEVATLKQAVSDLRAQLTAEQQTELNGAISDSRPDVAAAWDGGGVSPSAVAVAGFLPLVDLLLPTTTGLPWPRSVWRF